MHTPTLRLLIFFIVFFGLYICSQEKQPGVFFKNVKENDVLSSPINLEFGGEGFDLAPFGTTGISVGHHHLLATRDNILEGVVIPSDVNHIHFGKCGTKGTIELEPGKFVEG